MPNCIILGGGIAGISAALNLAAKGFDVTIVERLGDLLSGSSDNTPCRLGLGFHYIDIDTAKKYLRSTIKVLRKYPDYVLGHDLPPDHPNRRGRYFIVKNSQFSLLEVLSLHENLRNEYIRLIKEDPANKVLGEPEQFSTVLPLNKYQETVNTGLVVAGLETAEQTLDWPRLKKHLIEKVNAHPNITVLKNTEILKFNPAENNDGYEVVIQPHGDKPTTLYADIIINSTWQEIERLNKTAGFYMDTEHDPRTNRTKIIIEVQLDESKNDSELSHAMFFCFGAHAAFTPLGNGRAFVSYEPVTNIKDEHGVEQQSTGYDIPNFSKRLLSGGITDEEKDHYATEILRGASQYIPGLKNATYLNIRIGNVRTLGKVDINDPNSQHHKRSDDGIKTMSTGIIVNPSMKLLYFLEGGEKLLGIVEKHILTTELIRKAVKTSAPVRANPRLASVINHTLYRSIDPEKLLQKPGSMDSKTSSTDPAEILETTSSLVKAIDTKAKVIMKFNSRPK